MQKQIEISRYCSYHAKIWKHSPTQKYLSASLLGGTLLIKEHFILENLSTDWTDCTTVLELEEISSNQSFPRESLMVPLRKLDNDSLWPLFCLLSKTMNYDN